MGKQADSTKTSIARKLRFICVILIVFLFLSSVLIYEMPTNMVGSSLADSYDEKESEKDSNTHSRNSTNSSRSRADREDSDNDGLYDYEEIEAGTNPENWDSDGDGKADNLDYYPLNPSLWRSPFQIFLQVILEISVFFTIVFSFLIFRRLKKKNAD